jgi:hypothetical protein
MTVSHLFPLLPPRFRRYLWIHSRIFCQTMASNDLERELEERSPSIRENDRTPPSLCKLPDELLIQIARYVIRHKFAPMLYSRLLTITSVCSRLRQLFVSAPELWTRINVKRSQACIDTFLDRAQDLALEIELTYHKQDFDHQRATQLLPRTAHLNVETSGHEADALLVRAAQTTPMPLLHTLRIANVIRSYNPELGYSIHPSSQSLCTLTITYITVVSFPSLPALRCLALRGTSTPLDELFRVIRSAASLESLALDKAMMSPFPLESFEIPLLVPQLKRIYIHDILLHVGLLLKVLPHPSISLGIRIERNDMDVYDSEAMASPARPFELCVDRVRRIWDANFSHLGSFPTGRATMVGPACTRNQADLDFWYPAHFDAVDWVDEPSVRYSGIVCNLDSKLFLLQHIVSLLIYIHHVGGMVNTCFEALPNLQDVVVKYFANDDTDKEEGKEKIRVLETWIHTRHEQGRTLRSIRFRDSRQEAKGFYRRLVDGGLAEVVVWEAEKSVEPEWSPNSETADWFGD